MLSTQYNSLIEVQTICYSHNSIKLGLIGSSKSDALPELVELVSAHLKCMNTSLMEVLSIFHLSYIKMKSLEAENEELRRQLNQDKPKSSKYTHKCILALYYCDI